MRDGASAKATAPRRTVSGVISGTNFVAEMAICTAEVLRLFQGASVSPDRSAFDRRYRRKR